MDSRLIRKPAFAVERLPREVTLLSTIGTPTAVESEAHSPSTAFLPRSGRDLEKNSRKKDRKVEKIGLYYELPWEFWQISGTEGDL
ncbi:hypothetical protein [Paenibacillus flagellatus]|uniref:hypothetical protein n=1 Tax=Paenibacillus flagellatus TaxID=2211139 RepID=UPI0011B7505E|nr:hypothetical protein [Paenibacillus flagellatus]